MPIPFTQNFNHTMNERHAQMVSEKLPKTEPKKAAAENKEQLKWLQQKKIINRLEEA